MTPASKNRHLQPLRADDDPAPDWYCKCQSGKNGGVHSNHANVMLALREDPAWQGVIGYDLMRRTIMKLRPLPTFNKCRPSPSPKPPTPWTDNDDAMTQEWLQIAGLPSVALTTVVAAISQRAQECDYHPIRNSLKRLKWDGIPRIPGGTLETGEVLDPWLTTYLGVENTEYANAVGKMWLISAIARVMQPGCKADHMLILEGTQGSGKSTACRILAGDEYFSDTLPRIGHKDSLEHLRDKWIIEVAELDAMTKAESSAVKAFLSQQVDKYRPSYGRREIEQPRQCVFIGTTNRSDYLKDETGARRYWPVQTTKIDLNALETDRDQLWAEAYHLYQNDEAWHIADPALLEAAEREQANRFDADVWEEKIATFLHCRHGVTIAEIMTEALGIESARMDRGSQNRVRAVLGRLGWVKDRKTSAGMRWVPPDDGRA